MGGLRIGCIGEAMIELSEITVPGRATVGFAGDVLNTAIYLRRELREPHTVSFVSAFGQDSFSDRMEDFCRDEGLDTASIQRDPQRHPGLYAITTGIGGERSFTYWRSQSAARQLFQVDGAVSFGMLDDFDVLYLSGITLAILPEAVRDGLMGWLDQFRMDGGQVAFDSNYRPALWPDRATATRVIAQMWARCDIGLPSVDDEYALFDDADEAEVVARLTASGVTRGALKRGAQGPVALGSRHPMQMQFLAASNVVDTTAAGDSFNAGYLARQLTGAGEAECLAAGHTLAVKVVSHAGAILPR